MAIEPEQVDLGMEVIGSDGTHVGVVGALGDETFSVDLATGGRIDLTLAHVQRLENFCIRLNIPAWRAVQMR